MFSQISGTTSCSLPSSSTTQISPSSSSMPVTTPMVPFTQRFSLSFLTKMTWAPGFISSSIGAGREVRGNSPWMVPLNMLMEPSKAVSCWSLI